MEGRRRTRLLDSQTDPPRSADPEPAPSPSEENPPRDEDSARALRERRKKWFEEVERYEKAREKSERSPPRQP